MNIKSVLPSFLGENTYEFTLIDEKTGNIKQKVISHNLITNGFWLSLNKDSYYTNNAGFSGISLGSGTGTPSEEDNTLFSLLWGPKSFSQTTRKLSENKRSAEIIMSLTLPANHDYIGTVTEAGLIGLGVDSDGVYWSGYGKLYSHCLLKDAEGNPISIAKTENDKLKITVTLRINIPEKIGNFCFLPLDKGYLSNLVYSSGVPTGSGKGYGRMAGIFYRATLTLLNNRKPLGFPCEIYSYNIPGLGIKNASKEYALKKVTFNTQRLETSVGNNHYYFCLSVNGLGYYTLPNEEVFPTYNISNINVGLGDGSTLAFKNPLNYFKKNTDIVYINGQPKKRNIDYTIDNENNYDMLNELSAGNWIKNIYSEVDGTFNQNTGRVIPFFSQYEGSGVGNEQLPEYTDSNTLTGKVLKINCPLYIELLENKKINTCYIRDLCFMYDSNTYFDDSRGTSIIIKLEYSKDKQKYEEIFTSDKFNSITGKKFSFEPIEALYWRFTIINLPDFDEATSNRFLFYHYTRIGQSKQPSFLGYVGDDKITFKVPPAKDDIITMDVQMDVPFKNENYSIDTSATLEFV